MFRGGIMSDSTVTKILRLGVLGASLAVTAGYVAAADLSIEEVVVTGMKRDIMPQDLALLALRYLLLSLRPQ